MTARDLAILRAVQTLGDDANLVNIWRQVKYSRSAIDARLKYMYTDGLLSLRIGERLPGPGNRPRKYWRLTPEGEAAIQEGGE